jgi:hypothetical protein
MVIKDKEWYLNHWCLKQHGSNTWYNNNWSTIFVAIDGLSKRTSEKLA